MTGVLLTGILLLLPFMLKTDKSLTSEDRESYRVLFYNVENLFDNQDDPNTLDDDFTPEGDCHWTRYRLDRKVKYLSKAIIAASEGEYPDIIGIAEIENLWVLEHLVGHSILKNVPYGIIHKESPDPRGIDVALLYRKDRVVPVDLDFFTVVKEGKRNFQSRDILYFQGQMGGENIHFFVNHWPSRYGGYSESKKKRNYAARVLKEQIDLLLAEKTESKILIMGDFNATWNEACLSMILNAHAPNDINGDDCLVNLSCMWKRNGCGTLKSKGEWEIFDQFICSKAMIKGKGLCVLPQSVKICDAPFLLETDSKYLGSKPFRTYLGPGYHGGISDHLPISLVIKSY